MYSNIYCQSFSLKQPLKLAFIYIIVLVEFCVRGVGLRKLRKIGIFKECLIIFINQMYDLFIIILSYQDCANTIAMNKIYLENITKNQTFAWQTNQSVINFSHIIENLLEFQPQVNPKHISFMYKKSIHKKWLFISNDFRYEFTTQQNSDPSLWIRYKVYNKPKVAEETIKNIEQKVQECRTNLEDYKKRFDGDTIDVNLFWANPLCIKEKRKHNKDHEHIYEKQLIDHYPLKFSVQYRLYFQRILSTLKDSKKRIYLKINEFNDLSFKNKRQFSIAYLICHTEEVQKKVKVDFFEKKRKKSMSEKEEKNKSQEHKMEDVPNLGDKKYSHDQQNKKNYRQKNQEVTYQKEYEQYFIGQTKNGQFMKISPQQLGKQLQGKTIKLLILHTSYPFYHYPILKEKNIYQNLLLINSNPLYTDQSTEKFLQLLFKKILQGQEISKAHYQSIKDIENQFSNSFACCCYHEHRQGCNVRVQKKTASRFQTFHYMSHIVRCSCSQYHLLQHNCTDRYDIVQKQYKTFKGRQQVFQQIKNKKQLIYTCCCQKESQHQRYHSLQKKFQLLQNSKNKEYYFDFKEGQIKGDTSCIESFQDQFKLIGNRKLFITILMNFSKRKAHETKDHLILNIFGEKASGKSTLSNAICNILLHKKIFTQLQKKKFRRFQDIEFVKDDKTLYFLEYEPKKQKQKKFYSLKRDQLPLFPISAILITTSQIQMELSSHKNCFKIEPFSSEDCGNFIKASSHLNQRMKDKVKIFFNEFTWKEKWKDNYYPLLFDFPQVLSTIAESPYSQPSSQYLSAFENISDSQLVNYLLFMGIAILIPKQDRDKALEYLGQKNIFTEKITVETKKKKQKQIQIDKKVILGIENSERYFYLLYQQNCEKTEILERLLKYYVKLTHVRRCDVTLFDATTDDKGSVIYLLFKGIFNECLQMKLEDEQLQNYLKDQDDELILKSALDLVRRVLCNFYLFQLHDIGQNLKKVTLSILCLFIINNAIIYKKNKVFQDKQSDINSIQTQRTIHQIPSPLKKTKRSRKLSGELMKLEKIQSEESSLVLSSLIDMKSQTKFYSSKKQEQSSILNDSAIKEIKNPTIENDSEKKRKGEDDLLIKKNLLSKEGLVYLLRKLSSKKIQDHRIQIVTHLLTLQLFFEDAYQNDKKQETWKNIQTEISIIFEIDKKNKQLKPKKNLTPSERRLLYDLWIAMILKQTRCGRIKLLYDALSEILIKVSFNNESKKKYSVAQSKKKIYERILLKMCANNQVYNKMSQKITLNRYLQYNFQQEQAFSQLQCYEKLIDYWNQFNKYKNFKDSNNIRQYYYVVIKLYEELPHIKKYISNVMLLKLYDNLRLSVQNMLFRLRDKLLVLFVATPIEQKNIQIDEKDKFMVNFSEILDDFQEEPKLVKAKSETISLNSSIQSNYQETQYNQLEDQNISFFFIKLKLNTQNLQNLKNREGCRYLAISFHSSKQNSKTILGEDQEKGTIQVFLKDELIKKLFQIPFVYIFVCLPKPKFAEELRKMTSKVFEMVYFDFGRYMENKQAEKRIIMIIVIKSIIQKVEKGKEFHTAYIETKSELQFSYQKEIVLTNDHVQEVLKIESFQLEDQQYCKTRKTFFPKPIKKELIIKHKNLKAIQKVLTHLKNGGFSENPIKISCDEETFFQNFKYYMREKRGFSQAFQIQNQKTKPFSTFCEEIIKVYYSTKKLFIIFKNYEIKKANLAWVNEDFGRLFLEEKFYFNVGKQEIHRRIKKIIISLNDQKKHYFICAIETQDQS